MHNVLKRGDKGTEVKQLQELLWNHGFVGPDNPFWDSNIAHSHNITSPTQPEAKGFWLDGDYGQWTEEAVGMAQLQLLDSDNKMPLDGQIMAGVCDQKTWDALELLDKDQSPTQGLVVATKQVLTPGLGVEIVTVFNYYIKLGIKEIPNGSNRGPYVPPVWSGVPHGGINFWVSMPPEKKGDGPAYCCLTRCSVEHEAYGLVTGKEGWVNSKGRMGLCYGNMVWAKKQPVPDKHKDYYIPNMGWVIPVGAVLSGKVKLPTGAAMVMNYGGTRGHTGSVSKSIYDQEGHGVAVICCEANVGNRLDHRKRPLAGSAIKWFIVAPSLLDNPDFTGWDIKAATGTDKENTR